MRIIVLETPTEGIKARNCSGVEGLVIDVGDPKGKCPQGHGLTCSRPAGNLHFAGNFDVGLVLSNASIFIDSKCSDLNKTNLSLILQLYPSTVDGFNKTKAS